MDRQCGVCSAALDEASSLAHALEHGALRTRPDSFLFSCSECKLGFSLRTSLFAHLREAHPDGGGARGAPRPSARNLVVPGLASSLDQFVSVHERVTTCLECGETIVTRPDMLPTLKHLTVPGECSCRRTAQEWEQLAVLRRQVDVNTSKRAKLEAVEEDRAKPETEYLLASTLLLMETGLACDSAVNALAVGKLANEVYNLVESYGLTSSDVDSLFKV